MVYVPHTDEERRQMLAAIGVEDLAALFADVPAQYRYPALGLPEPASEMEITQELREIAASNLNAYEVPMFLGAGAYRHWVLSPAQWIAVGFALAGVAWLTLQAGSPPWIALGLAFSFGLYGLVRKLG